MAAAGTIYRTLFKKSSTFTLTVLVGAFFMEAIIDKGSKYIFKSINKGKLWDDIKDNYEPKVETTEKVC